MIGPRGPRGDAGPQGEPGRAADAQPPEPTLAIEPDGLVGTVSDPSGRSLTSGRVYLVPAADVEALAKEPIDLTLSPEDVVALGNDEPLEDLIDQHGDDYASAAVGDDGAYRFAELANGAYFVVWEPSGDDALHLPGGSACRSARDRAALVGTRLDLRVSGRPSEHATYVGSSGCLGCHGRHRTMRTTHRLSLQAPGVRGAFQDPSMWPELDKGISQFDQGTTLYYYDCDSGLDADGPCRVSSTDPTIATPSAVVSFELQLTRNPAIAREDVGAYTLTIVNRAGSGSTSYDVALTYGGMLSKQHYLTRIRNGDGSFSYYLLPLQLNTAGDDGANAFQDWRWRDYRSSDWYDVATSKLIEPDAGRSFDAQCAGCHLTGMRLSGTSQSGWNAHAVGDLSGDFDYDGDGRREEINIGCESCHGPASEHLEAKVRGVNIVSPSLLTPERELMLCGRCHSRAQGHGGGGSEAPLSADGEMPRPGLRRSELASEYVARVDGDASDFYPSGDSRAQHAQYSDFLRTTMHRNGSVLMTCTSCHDAHGSDENAHELRRAADDNTACTGCHSADKYVNPRQHVEAATKFVHDGSSDADFVCTRCHMVRTVVSGARHPELLDKIPSSPTVQYYHGDIASHRFVVTGRAHYAEQPIAATLRCGFCHGTDFANP